MIIRQGHQKGHLDGEKTLTLLHGGSMIMRISWGPQTLPLLRCQGKQFILLFMHVLT